MIFLTFLHFKTKQAYFDYSKKFNLINTNNSHKNTKVEHG